MIESDTYIFREDEWRLDNKNSLTGRSDYFYTIVLEDYTQPWAFIASATFRKPAMLAPAI